MFMKAASEFESPLYRTALGQLDTIAEHLSLEPSIHERLRYPRRALTVSVPVRMDDGRTEVFISRLQEIMTRAVDRVWATAARETVTLRAAALMEGIGRVAEAHRLRGLYP